VTTAYDDMQRTLEHRDYFARPPVEVGVVTHDVHREDRGEPGAPSGHRGCRRLIHQHSIGSLVPNIH
jgi:hypothetical protein